MTEQNASRPSETDRRVETPRSESALGSLSTKEIKTLYNLSRTVRALCFFWLLAISISMVIIANPQSAAPASLASMIYPIFAVLAGFAVFGTWRFRNWGRILSMMLCVVLLLEFPMGTIIGLLGLVALWRSKRLFGQNRLSQDQLKTELEHRKLNNVA